MKKDSILKGSFYDIKANEFCSFGVKIIDLNEGGFLGITHFNHIYKFSNNDFIGKNKYKIKEISNKDWKNNY